MLWKADGKVLTGPEDLLKAVNAAKSKKLALELIREGKKVTVNVQPGKKRPQELGKAAGGWGDAADMQELEGWLSDHCPAKGRRRGCGHRSERDLAAGGPLIRICRTT